MNVPWKNFISPWWPSASDANVRFPVPPMPQVDELRREPWPTIVAQTSSQLPVLPISSGPPQGGLLASLNAGTSGGILGGLTAPVEHLNSANYWRGMPTPMRLSIGPMPGSDYYLSPILPAPSWESVSTRDSLEPPSRSPWNAPAGNSDAEGSANSGGEDDGVPQILSDTTPDNSWIPGADYAGEGHHEFPRALYKRMPPETRKVFDQAVTGHLYLGYDNRRHEYDSFHQEYNRATGELLKRFMTEQNIGEPEQMTPDHARAVLKAIAESEDPRIRLYREFIRRLRLFYWLRTGGRGSE